MKALTKVLLASCLVINAPLFAQKPQTDCVDAAIQSQADGIKLGFSKKGMTVFQEAMFRMQSMEPVPVAVKMVKGVSYQLVFVGSESANKLTMEIFDGKDHKLDEKIERSMNHIVYSFTPSKTDVYLITLYQKKGTKDMCGYFGVMMKGTPRPAAAPKKEQPVQPKPAAAQPKPVTTTPKPAAAKPAQGNKAMPDNQIPNQNRTRATREAQQQKGK